MRRAAPAFRMCNMLCLLPQMYRTMVALQTVDTIFYEAQRQASTHVD